MADTLICGGCRFVTCDFEVFKDHRIAGCQNVKVEGEPKQMRCASCNQRFGSAWALMCHLTDFHRMQLYREDEQPPITPSESADPVPAKKSSSYIMPMDSTKSLPLPEGETASANVTPIGQGAVEPKTSEVVAPHMPPPAVPQWNPMTGHTIVGLQGLQPPPQNDGPQPIPSLGGGISTIYGVH